jgi:hypothetical protein
MEKWAQGWTPRDRDEAQEYLDAHPGDTDDPEIIEACRDEIKRRRPPPPTPGPGGGGVAPSPFVADDPPAGE